MYDYINQKYEVSEKDDLVCEFKIDSDDLKASADNIASNSTIGKWDIISNLNPKLANDLKPKIFDINNETNTVKIAYNRELFVDGSASQIMSFLSNASKNSSIVDVNFPKRMLKYFPGPRYGLNGIRKLINVKSNPLTCCEVTPYLGVNSAQYSRIAYNSWIGGMNFVKDNPILTNQLFNKFDDRVIRCLDMQDRAKSETGEKKLYIPNITSETLEMIKRADFVKDHGGSIVSVDVTSCGLSALQSLRKNTSRFIHADFSDKASIINHKIARLIGCDSINIGNPLELNYPNNDFSILESELDNIKPAFAICSNNIHINHIPKLITKFNHNIIIQANELVHNHPDGTIYGSCTVKQIIDATLKKIPLEKYAKTNRELDKALQKWGLN